jgi:conjugal transfer/entry exclusion protein
LKNLTKPKPCHHTLSCENSRLQAVFDEMKEQAKARVALYHTLETEFALLTDQYETLQEKATQREATVQLLRSEKAKLTQTNAQLVGQLKPLQLFLSKETR